METLPQEELARELAGDEPASRSRLDDLALAAVFGTPDLRDEARRTIRRLAARKGILPASIYPLYTARGRGEVGGFTVPAINIRALSYDTARAVIRAANRRQVGALIFEIARSEIGYTDQRPAEYAAVVLAAAVREGWSGPIFLQGDHYQTNPRKMAADPASEIAAIEQLIVESIGAGFFQIDIDTSTLVDLSRPSVAEQQRANFETAAHFTRFIRSHEPPEATISIGGEIGEVGKANSTPEEFRAYMDGYLGAIGTRTGIAKVSIQTGSAHGGMVNPDGTRKRMTIDFEVIRTISRIAREEYGLAGAVQHGASTLPPEDFGLFAGADCAEIHLATEFQNMIYDHPAFPREMRVAIARWLRVHCAGERKPGQSEEQFIYSTRKKAIGPWKESFWNLPEGARAAIGQSLEEKFDFLFEKLSVGGTRSLVSRYVKPVAVAESSRPSGCFVRDDEAGD